MPENLANPIADSIRNIGSLFDPRRRAEAQQLRSREALTKAQTQHTQAATVTEGEKSRGLKSQNDARDVVRGHVDALGDMLGWDKRYTPVLADALLTTQGKNPAQVMEGVRKATGLAQLFSENPEAMRHGMAILGNTPTNTTALTTGEQTQHFNQAQAGRMQVQQLKNAGRPNPTNPELAGIDAQIKANEAQYSKAAADWRLGKMAIAQDPKKFPSGQAPFEKELESMRAEHDALVQRANMLRQQMAQTQAAGSQSVTPPLPQGPGAPAVGAATLFDQPPSQSTPGAGFSFGASANPSAPLPPGPNQITVGQPKVLDAQTAQQFLMQAGGDRERARAAARAAGYAF